MTTPIVSNRLTVRETSPRMTPVPTGRRFADALATGGRAVLQGALSAASFVPGANMVAATVRGAVAPLLSTAAPPSGATLGTSTNSLAGLGHGAGSSTGASAGTAESPVQTATGASTGSGASGTGDDMLARSQEMSMQMLQLQEAMNDENRRFTTVSNVLHARDEMAKTAIGNIR